MDTQKCRELANELMTKHGLTDWTFQFDESIRRFGYCHSRKKLISMSWKLVSLNNETEVKDTILHEIAHALTPKCHHNWKWKAKALEIGCNGHRCYGEEVITPKAKYKTICPVCGHEGERNKIKNCSCGHCSRVYDPTRKLIYKLND